MNANERRHGLMEGREQPASGASRPPASPLHQSERAASHALSFSFAL